jgi:hypothetical protein
MAKNLPTLLPHPQRGRQVFATMQFSNLVTEKGTVCLQKCAKIFRSTCPAQDHKTFGNQNNRNTKAQKITGAKEMKDKPKNLFFVKMKLSEFNCNLPIAVVLHAVVITGIVAL